MVQDLTNELFIRGSHVSLRIEKNIYLQSFLDLTRFALHSLHWFFKNYFNIISTHYLKITAHLFSINIHGIILFILDHNPIIFIRVYSEARMFAVQYLFSTFLRNHDPLQVWTWLSLNCFLSYSLGLKQTFWGIKLWVLFVILCKTCFIIIILIDEIFRTINSCR